MFTSGRGFFYLCFVLIDHLMDKIRIKCPVCGAILEALDDPANVEKNVKCPNCNQRNKFKDFKRIVPAPTPIASENDETQIATKRNDSVGYLLDRATYRRYPLREGKQLVGRKPHKNPPKADIPIETTDQGMSREHLYIEVMAGRDGRNHVYVSNAKNQNPTEINGVKLADGDKVGIRHGDVIKLCDTQLVYVGTPIDDATEI